jgi:hypothetical protein
VHEAFSGANCAYPDLGRPPPSIDNAEEEDPQTLDCDSDGEDGDSYISDSTENDLNSANKPRNMSTDIIIEVLRNPTNTRRKPCQITP